MTDENETIDEATCATCGGTGESCPDCEEFDEEDCGPCCDSCGEPLDGEGFAIYGEVYCPACRPCCDSCGEVLQDEGQPFADETYCRKCFETETFACPKCSERWHVDDRTNRGWCPDCRDAIDTETQSALDDLWADDRGHEIRAALVAAGLIEAK
jgi:hypothetical protein